MHRKRNERGLEEVINFEAVLVHLSEGMGVDMSIFGGTSGIGLSAAQQAKAAGARVTVIGFDAAGAERVAAENGFAGWRAADVTQPETIIAALKDIDHVDHLVLLAGTFVAGKILKPMSAICIAPSTSASGRRCMRCAPLASGSTPMAR